MCIVIPSLCFGTLFVSGLVPESFRLSDGEVFLACPKLQSCVRWGLVYCFFSRAESPGLPLARLQCAVSRQTPSIRQATDRGRGLEASCEILTLSRRH
uniref:Transmembrane protein n=1 Tax=Toxoplasma gondii COUG TaxID=1074873 RepID=A0A2G8XS05_TOXGO|nr:hypothetical protein TGCOUG_294705 [Toxoplasma gondii COUG]